MTNTSNITIGIDAGGTKTHLVARQAGIAESWELKTTGVNLQRDGETACAELLATAVRLLLNRKAGTAGALPAGGLDLVLGAGVAGAGREADQHALASRLEQDLRTGIDLARCTVHVTSDAEIAFRAAHSDQAGLLIIIGTGTILLARTREGRLHRSGGWGRILGDEGGGYKIGLAGLKAVANAIDGGPGTVLTDRLCASFSLCSTEHLLNFVYRDRAPMQELAPLILDSAAAGDAVASQIIHHQVLSLTARLKWLVQSAPPFPRKCVLMGGLSRHAFYRQELMDSMVRLYPECSFHPPQCEPAEAALDWAQWLVRGTAPDQR